MRQSGTGFSAPEGGDFTILPSGDHDSGGGVPMNESGVEPIRCSAWIGTTATQPNDDSVGALIFAVGSVLVLFVIGIVWFVRWLV